MNYLKKMQIILLVIVLNFFFVFSSYANDSRKALECLASFTDGKTIFHRAVEESNTKKIDSYLDRGGQLRDINLRDSEGKTPLQIAVERNDIKVVDFLIRKGAIFGSDNLKIAVERGYKEIAKLLIDKGVDVNEISYINSYEAPLSTAIKKNDIKMVELLISLGAEADFKEVLIEVVKIGDLKQLKRLKDLSESDFETFITDALDIAVKKGHKEIIEFIVQSTNLLRALNKMTALLEIPFSRETYDKDMAELLIRLREENSSRLKDNYRLEKISNKLGRILTAEVSRGISKENLEYLISLGADVNKVYKGRVALNIAVDANRPEIVELLIRAGAELNLRNSSIETPLMRAILMDNIEMAKLLIDKGVNVNAGYYYKYQKIPLIVAIERNDIKWVKFFINQEKTDINKHDLLGETPLYKAYKVRKTLKKEEDITINKKITELLISEDAAMFTKKSQEQSKKVEEKNLAYKKKWGFL